MATIKIKDPTVADRYKAAADKFIAELREIEAQEKEHDFVDVLLFAIREKVSASQTRFTVLELCPEAIEVLSRHYGDHYCTTRSIRITDQTELFLRSNKTLLPTSFKLVYEEIGKIDWERHWNELFAID